MHPRRSSRWARALGTWARRYTGIYKNDEFTKMMINLQNDGPGVRAGRVSCLKLSLITYRIDHNQRIFQARNTTCKHTEEFMEINEKIPITSYTCTSLALQ